MKFNIYLKPEIGHKVTLIAKRLNRSQNSIINEALKEWLDRHFLSQWSEGFFDFEPITNIPDFKESQKELNKDIPEDPFNFDCHEN